MNAAKQAAEHSMDEEEVEAIRASVEQASADAAREAARADALARAARQMGPSGSSQLFDLERLRVKHQTFLIHTSLLMSCCQCLAGCYLTEVIDNSKLSKQLFLAGCGR